MILKGRARNRRNGGGKVMPALLDAPRCPDCGNAVNEMNAKALDDLVVGMGKRLQAEYIEGAIPYLREREPELWAQLEALDRDESLESLLAYERLFFEGLRRYVSYLEAGRQAA